MSKDKDQQIESVLLQQKDELNHLTNSIENLLDANEKLDESRQLKQEVAALKKEAPSLPWFKRLIHIIPQVKYLFIKNDEEIAEEKRKTNRVMLEHVDNTLRKIGTKSLDIQEIINEELKTGLNKILKKKLIDEQQDKALELQHALKDTFSKLDGLSHKNFREELVPEVYNVNEALELNQQRERLLEIQKNITKLVDANKHIEKILSIKKELTELQQTLPSTWLDGLKKITAKIKHVFVTTPEQILKDTLAHNNEKLKHIEKALAVTGKNIEDSTIARTNKLHKELEKLTKRKLSPDQLKAAEDLSSKLESTFVAASVASQPLSTSQDLAQSQALSSSMPERITPTRQAPPIPSLMRATSMPNPTIHQATENTITRSLSSSSPIHTSLQDSQNIQHGEKAKQTPRSFKYQAPQPPLQNQEVQQAAEFAIPPAPPLPGQNTLLRQTPPPPTHSVPLQNQDVQQAVGRDIPTPPPLPPVSNIPPPSPIEGLNAAQRVAGNAMAAAPPPPPPPPPLPPTNITPPPPPLSTQPKSPIEGQGERSPLLGEIEKGIQLKKTVPTEKQATNEQKHLEAIQKGIKLKKVPDSVKQHRDSPDSPGKVKPVVEESGEGAALRKAIEARAKAFQDDDDDNEPEHADLVKLIEDKIVDENTLKTLINKAGVKIINKAGVKNDKELIELINDDQIWDDYDREEKRDKVIKQLEKIKESLDRGELAKLPSNPVANVDMTKGQFPPKLQSAAKAIGENLPMTPKYGYKTLPPTPSPKLVGIKKEAGSREV